MLSPSPAAPWGLLSTAPRSRAGAGEGLPTVVAAADADLFTQRPRLQLDPRRVLAGIAVLIAAVIAFLALGSPAATLDAALARLRVASPLPIALAVLAEGGSFAGYALLTWLVAGSGVTRITLLVSAQITLAGAAITRLLPTAGLGGIGLTLWALRRAGRTATEATSTLLTFLVLLYAVFLAALTAAGAAALAGDAGGAPAWIGVAPVSFGALALLLAIGVAAYDPASVGGRDTRSRLQPIRLGAVALGCSFRKAARIVTVRDPRLLGALAWWGLDVAVLALAFSALGDTPALGIVAVGYFTGIVANTIPVPGAVSAGMSSVLLLCGVPVDLVLPAVLLYRAIALWLPLPIGLVALLGLRRTARRWKDEDVRGHA